MRYDDSLNIGYINDDAWIVGMSAVLAGVVCLGLLCLVCCAVGGIAGWMATKWSETGKNERREVAEYISDEV